MTRNVDGITYSDLSRTLVHIGFEERERTEARSYLHRQSGAFIVYPRQPLADTAQLHHVLEARATVDGFGLMDATDFDLLLLRESSPRMPADIGPEQRQSASLRAATP